MNARPEPETKQFRCLTTLGIIPCLAAVAWLAAAAAAAESGTGRVEPASPAPDTLTVVHWNVENLFDADDDPANKGDDEFIPGSWRHWNAKRYSEKIENIARVLADAAGDIVCLTEIENRRVLDDIRSALAARRDFNYPHVLHREGPDHRGIDVAILSKYKAENVEWLLPVPEQREIVVADFKPADQPLTVIANHWKSRLGEGDDSENMRTLQARAVRDIVNRRLKADPGAAIVVAGDFNDDFDSPLMIRVLGSGTNLSLAAAVPGPPLFNLHAGLEPAKRGTIYYRKGKEWNSFDSVHVSRSLLDRDLPPDGWKAQRNGYEVFSRPYMMRDGIPTPYRITSQAGTKKRVYQTGFSDHLPVRLALELSPKRAARQDAQNIMLRR